MFGVLAVIAGASIDTVDATSAGSGEAGVAPAPPAHYRTWGSAGTGDGQFQWYFDTDTGVLIFLDIAVSAANGHVYVTDPGNGRVQRFDANGGFVAAWNGFNAPESITSTPAGDLLVLDHSVLPTDEEPSPPVRIHHLTPEGQPISPPWDTGTPGRQVVFDPTTGHVLVVGGGVREFELDGTVIGLWSPELRSPDLLAIDPRTGDRVVMEERRIATTDEWISEYHLRKYTATGVPVWTRVDQGTSIDINPVTGDIYVGVSMAFQNPGGLREFTAAGRLRGTVGRGEAMSSGAAVSANGNLVYVIRGVSIEAYDHVQPDLRARSTASRQLRFNDQWGSGYQTIEVRGVPAVATYVLSSQNDGNRPQALRIRGDGSNPLLRMTYRRADNRSDVTGAVTRGTYRTPVLAPGASHDLLVEIRRQGSNPPGPLTPWHSVELRASSTLRNGVADVVWISHDN